MYDNLPENWPQMYSRIGVAPKCGHQMHWDDADECYRCLNCSYTEDEPPENKILDHDF